MDTETINDKKNQIYSLLEDFFDEYNRIDSTRIQSRCENDLELRRLSDIIASQENEAKQRIKRVQELEQEVQSKIKQNHEYETMINSLQEKLSVADEEKIEENKFNMVIIQANEMSQKDREIERLNKVIKTLKEQYGGAWGVVSKDPTKLKTRTEPKSSTIDELMDVVETKLETVDTDETVVEAEENVETEINVETTGPADPEGTSEEDEENKIEDNKIDERGGLLIFTYRNKDYYIYENEEPQIIYDVLENKDIGEEMGVRKKNEKGKFRTYMHKK